MVAISEESRRLERERVLSLLYETEMKGESIDTILAALPVTPEDFVVETVRGVSEDTAGLDSLIDRFAVGWKTDRMASIDKNVLRIAAYELQARNELSVAVIISEAVELAKRFSTEDSGKFVNGILSSMATSIRG